MFRILVLLLLLPYTAIAQEVCSDSEQATQDACEISCIAECRDANPECLNRAATVQGAVNRTLTLCCRRSRARTRVCLASRKRFARLAKRVYPSQFSSEAQKAIAALTPDDCTTDES